MKQNVDTQFINYMKLRETKSDVELANDGTFTKGTIVDYKCKAFNLYSLYSEKCIMTGFATVLTLCIMVLLSQHPELGAFSYVLILMGGLTLITCCKTTFVKARELKPYRANKVDLKLVFNISRFSERVM